MSVPIPNSVCSCVLHRCEHIRACIFFFLSQVMTQHFQVAGPRTDLFKFCKLYLLVLCVMCEGYAYMPLHACGGQFYGVSFLLLTLCRCL